MENIKNLSFKELEETLAGWGEQAFRARQIYSWIYEKGVRDFSAMSNLSGELKGRLEKNFSLWELKVKTSLVSEDATEKFLFGLKDGGLIEAVLIPARERATGCISSQVGCRFACRFCASGLAGFKRNLTCAEILEEALSLRDNSRAKKLTHLVFMGTGEPLDNYDNCLKAIRIINSPLAMNIGARRITISTCGIIPGIERLSTEGLQVELSVSLHASDDATRSRLLPVNKIYSLSKLISACRNYIEKTDRQVTFEYIMIKNFNSALQNAEKLVKLLSGLNCKVNLIPCNPVEGLQIEPPNKLEVLFFKDYLLKHGLNTTLRKVRGQDIDASCGQLRLRHGKEQ